nr:retrotransposon protein, putative, Ty3-gypsy subclass [Tanacetum cinerariifolium]
MSMANRLTTDGIKDGLFKKKENTGNKKRSNDYKKNRGRDDRNKKQRTGGNFALTVPEQVLFDSGADYSFISTNFLPLINMKPSVIIPSYEIEIASGVKVETNEIIRGCRLELEGYTYNIDLIPFGYGSFDVIVGMDWLSKLRAKIVCYEKIVKISLSNEDILEVHGERLAGYYRRFIANFLKIAKPLTLLTNKNKKFEWGDEQENAFQTLKDILCDAPLLELPEGTNDFVVYCDALNQGFNCVLMQRNKKELNMRQRRWIELFSDYDCEIRYHPGKANVVADALRKKKRLKPRRAQAMSLTIHSSITARILEAQSEASKDKPLRLLQQPEIPEWKWENITMDFISKLPRTRSGHDSIWVIVDRLTKLAHFLAVCEDFKIEKLARLYINKIVARHGTRLDLSTTYHPKINGQKFSYNNSYHSSVKCAPFEALYGRKCQTPIAWAEVGESKLIGPEIIQETIDKIVQIKERLKTTQDCQKSYADNRRKPLEFSVGDKIVERVSPVAYRLRLPQELIRVHDTFHVSNLKKCLADANLHVPLEEVKIDDKLHFVEEPMEIMDCEVKKLKRRRIPILKVRWNSRRGPKFI